MREGEVVGIIGRNGAGKSTLLKILSRITDPTSGRAKVYGRVGSLLEVGTGFHQELTGRENIFLNGAILGMSRSEIRRQFDEIVAFAEVEKFLDTPVKRYSSGMYVRLAFAVAAHLDPEILIIDEVLAVGDAAFQKKCLGKMRDVSRGGRTVLFVSHNMTAISNLCQRAIWLEGGRVRSIGDAAAEVTQYSAELLSMSAATSWQREKSLVNIGQVRLSSGDRDQGALFNQLDPITIKLDVTQLEPKSGLRFVVRIRSIKDDVIALETTDWDAGRPLAKGEGGIYTVECRLPANLFNPGLYSLSVGIDEPGGPVYVLLDNVMTFSITHTIPESGHLEERNTVISPFQHWAIGPRDGA